MIKLSELHFCRLTRSLSLTRNITFMIFNRFLVSHVYLALFGRVVRWAHSHCTLQSRLVSCRPQIHWVERVTASQTIQPSIHRYVDNERYTTANTQTRPCYETTHTLSTQSIEKEIVGGVLLLLFPCVLRWLTHVYEYRWNERLIFDTRMNSNFSLRFDVLCEHRPPVNIHVVRRHVLN